MSAYVIKHNATSNNLPCYPPEKENWAIPNTNIILTLTLPNRHTFLTGYKYYDLKISRVQIWPLKP